MTDIMDEICADLARKLAKVMGDPARPLDVWAVGASEGKPYMKAGRLGTIAHGTLATWHEFELIAAAINALPRLLERVASADVERAERDSWRRTAERCHGETLAAEKQVSIIDKRAIALERALESARTALAAAQDRDQAARFRANSPKQDQDVKQLRGAALASISALSEQREKP